MGRSRWTAAVLVIVAATFFVAIAASAHRPVTRSRVAAAVAVQRILSEQIVSQINSVRAAHGLPGLTLVPRLRAAAVSHSVEMADDGYFAHGSADGTAFRQRLRAFYGAAGLRRWQVGETLLWWSPGVSAVDTVKDWLQSPVHRAIVLGAGWRDVGVGAVHVVHAARAFGGAEATIITADFGVRSR